MPIPEVKKDETKNEFVGRCFISIKDDNEYVSDDQRFAVCYAKYGSENKTESLDESISLKDLSKKHKKSEKDIMNIYYPKALSTAKKLLKSPNEEYIFQLIDDMLNDNLTESFKEEECQSLGVDMDLLIERLIDNPDSTSEIITMAIKEAPTTSSVLGPIVNSKNRYVCRTPFGNINDEENKKLNKKTK